jgi:hypothetical protein
MEVKQVTEVEQSRKRYGCVNLLEMDWSTQNQLNNQCLRSSRWNEYNFSVFLLEPVQFSCSLWWWWWGCRARLMKEPNKL